MLCFCLAGCFSVQAEEEVSAEDLRWYYMHMEEDEQVLYERMLNAFLAWEPSLNLEGVPLEQVRKVHSTVLAEHPELFHVSEGFGYYESGQEMVVQWLPEYRLDADEYQILLEEAEAVAEQILADVQGLSRFEAAHAIHDWLVEHVEYVKCYGEEDVLAYEDGLTVHGALVEGKANCVGYARSMCWLLKQAGIPVLYMNGSAKDGQGGWSGHAWNVVNLNGEWSFVDVTWDDVDGLESPHPSHAYFNVGSAFFEESHDLSQNRCGAIPDVKERSDSWYRRQGHLLDSAEQFQAVLKKEFGAGTALEVQFTNAEAFSQSKASLKDWVNEASPDRKHGYWSWTDERTRQIFVWTEGVS